MLKKSNCKTLLAAFVLTIAMAATCAASVTTGTPPYQSFGGGPDVINFGNLNVHYSHGTSVLQDGSGITVYVDGYYDTPSASVKLKSGEVITPQLSSGSSLTGNGNSTDTNGNQITSSTVNGTTTFTDTLGTTALT